MIGASGTTTLQNYPNQAQSPDLANSSSRGGSVFYNRQLSSNQSAGATYQYSREVSTLSNSQTKVDLDTVNFFYTIHLMDSLTMSLTAGPQRFDVVISPFATVCLVDSFCNWECAAWQRDRTDFVASYSHDPFRAAEGYLEPSSRTRRMNESRHAGSWRAPGPLDRRRATSIRKNVSVSSLSSDSGGHSRYRNCHNRTLIGVSG